MTCVVTVVPFNQSNSTGFCDSLQESCKPKAWNNSLGTLGPPGRAQWRKVVSMPTYGAGFCLCWVFFYPSKTILSHKHGTTPGWCCWSCLSPKCGAALVTRQGQEPVNYSEQHIAADCWESIQSPLKAMERLQISTLL